jgi:hypothetical protein
MTTGLGNQRSDFSFGYIYQSLMLASIKVSGCLRVRKCSTIALHHPKHCQGIVSSFCGMQFHASHPAFAGVLALLIAYATFTLVRSIYRIYFHPLSSFRGDWQSCVSQSWVKKQSNTGHAEYIYAELHKKYSEFARS